MEKMFLTGRLTKDAVVKTTNSGKSFVTFSVAANSKSRGEDKVTYYDILWSGYREKMVQYLTKGTVVSVVGDLDAHTETSEKDGRVFMRLNLFADSVQFLEFGAKTNNASAPAAAVASTTATPVMTTYSQPVVAEQAHVQQPMYVQPTPQVYAQPVQQPVYAQPAPQPVYAAPVGGFEAPAGGDDLPF